MTTIRTIVTKAFREAGIIEVGGVPDAAEFEEGLEALQTLYSSLFGNELGEPLTPVNYGKSGTLNSFATAIDDSSCINSTYIPPNVRLMFNLTEDVTLYLHPKPQDGCRLGIIDSAGNFNTNSVTLQGNGRKIEDASSITLNTADTNSEWFYRADLGEWVKVTDLVAEDASPLPREFDDLLSTLLAFRINPRYGAQTSDESMEVLKRMRKIFRARYKQITEISSEDAILRLSSNPYAYYWMQSSTSAFDRGRP